MDGMTAKVYNGVKCYWRTRGYNRLGTSGREQEQSGQQPRRRRRLWRIRLNLKLKFKLPRSPKKVFIGLRDAYVRIMMKLANTSVVRGITVAGYNGDGFGKTMTVKEYDEKVIIEICKNLAIRQNQISSQSQIACSG
ncbi:hypothetical protein L1987_50387 [Smallanthus sonchifolius]|uniref:Uncharacterized protein n=1 Tax=Smallanthus sonchifolius TaxID=185202 RepID=A0ACB9ELW1_9ASTR|nr:hypothetical protein L1987_50387 [Smallanthus sonchifolius]